MNVTSFQIYNTSTFEIDLNEKKYLFIVSGLIIDLMGFVLNSLVFYYLIRCFYSLFYQLRFAAKT